MERKMEYKPLEEIRNTATVVSVPPSPQQRRERRRARLERLAAVLERHDGAINLFSRLEYLSASERSLLRVDNSPLAIAYRDPVLRAQGLAGDRMGEAVEFFDLSAREVHHLLCDCHVAGPITSRMTAARVRAIAQRRTFGEIWAGIRSALRF
jgi:hypothetical protein